MSSEINKIFKCRHCTTPLGIVIGGRLKIGAVFVEFKRGLVCSLCYRDLHFDGQPMRSQLQILVDQIQLFYERV